VLLIIIIIIIIIKSNYARNNYKLILFLGHKFTLPKYVINNTGFVGLGGCTVGAYFVHSA
jgi:hypothetical protein